MKLERGIRVLSGVGAEGEWIRTDAHPLLVGGGRTPVFQVSSSAGKGAAASKQIAAPDGLAYTVLPLSLKLKKQAVGIRFYDVVEVLRELHKLVKGSPPLWSRRWSASSEKRRAQKGRGSPQNIFDKSRSITCNVAATPPQVEITKPPRHPRFSKLRVQIPSTNSSLLAAKKTLPTSASGLSHGLASLEKILEDGELAKILEDRRFPPAERPQRPRQSAHLG